MKNVENTENIIEENKIDLLIKTIIRRDLKEFDNLLKEIDNVNEIDSNGDYPIVSAAWSSNFEMVKRLLKAGANPNLKSRSRSKRNGQPALLLAIPAQIEIVKLLLANKADPNITDNNGVSPLMKCAKTLDLIDEILINAGANFNIRDNDGETFLMKVIRNNRIKVFNKIISKVTNINALDKTGKFTALDYANILMNTSMIDIMKKYGAKSAKEL